MSKRLFQVLDEMNLNDEVNKTGTVGVNVEMVGAKTVKGGGHVTIGVPKEVITQLFFGGRVAILLIVDKKEYDRLEAQPIEAAEARADRYEKALREIRDMDHISPDAYAMKLKAYWALTPNTTNDDTVNG